MKILFVYPQYPDTFWSFKYALRLIAKKAAYPPLGLLTIAAMLPDEWEKKLVDMNVTSLNDEDLRWADYVFISAMVVQRNSTKEVINRSKKYKTKIVAGGPLFTTGYEEFEGVDHFVLDEAEITLPPFLKDLEKESAKYIYASKQRPDITKTPIPLWSLLDKKKYAALSIQYSRGCPFNCEFCDIVILNGHKPRTKNKEQVLVELDALYNHGWRGTVFIVDDNFIGNKRKLKAEILPVIIDWMKENKYPFSLHTEVSVNLADDEELMQLMTEAGFCRVFVGIETPNEKSLTECNKYANKNRDLVASVKKIQNHGLEVQGGFIVGFDSDPLSIFTSQISFIQRSGIVTAMVGLLNAPRGTALYKRLEKENRLLKSFTGDNTDCSLNFIPKMNHEALIKGYKHIMHTIYSPKKFYERIKVFLKEFNPRKKKGRARLQPYHLRGLINSMWLLGVRENGRRYYWRFFVSVLLKYPRSFPLSVSLTVYGLHFRKVIETYISLPIDDILDMSQPETRQKS
ncbi:B12-binding domain-containing radical SAM protein [Chloroflexota bacterium]